MSKKDKKETNLVKSVNKNIRSSTRKLNPILKGIVGKKVNLAIRDLDFSNKRICKDIKKTLSSAIANAENNNSLDIDELIVKNILIDEGPTGKRYMPRARGRVNQILKRSSHITVIVSDGRES